MIYQVTFWDWRYGRTVEHSPYYKTQDDCDRFIAAMQNLPNENDFSGYEINIYEPEHFVIKDIDKFKKI